MTKLTRWEPYRELEELSDRLNQLFTSPWHRPMSEPKEGFALSDWTPAVDIEESNEEFVVRAELPSVKKEDIKVKVEDGVLTIQGERRQQKEEKGRTFRRVERNYGAFARSFVMPAKVLENKVLADFKDGMLTVHVPKAPEEEKKAKEIEIH